MFYTYVLLCFDSKRNKQEFYIGFSNNLPSRESDHKSKRVMTTKRFDKIYLVYFEACLNKKDAIVRERQLKTGFGRGYIKRRIKSYLDNMSP